MLTRRLSRRILLASAARAGVGAAAVALIGCGGPAVRNVRERPDAPPTRERQAEEEQAAVAQSRAERSAPMAAATCNRPPLGISDTWRFDDSATVPAGDPVDPLEWRERYHWRNLPRPGALPRPGGELALSTPGPAVWSPIPLGLDRATGGGLSLLPLLYGRLVGLAAGDGIDAHRRIIQGDLAESWETPDETTLVFRLRRGVIWPESGDAGGRELSAGDVRAMHEMYREPEALQSRVYRAVASIEADDAAGTVAFSLAEPSAPLLSEMAGPEHVVMPPGWTPADAGTTGSAQAPPPGTGPFRFAEGLEPYGSWRLDRNPEYSRGGAGSGRALPRLDAVRGGLLPDGNAGGPRPCIARRQVWEAWLDGGLDAMVLESPGEVAASLERHPDAAVQVTAPIPDGGWTLEFPSGGVETADPRVRRALSMALDRGELARALHHGLAAPDCGMDWTLSADGGGGWREWPWTAEELGSSYRFDPAGARALVEAAGYSETVPLRIGLGTPAMNQETQYAAHEERVRAEAATQAWRAAFGPLARVETLTWVLGFNVRVNAESGRRFAAGRNVNVSLAPPPSRFGTGAELAWFRAPADAAFQAPPLETEDGELRRLSAQQRRMLDPIERSGVLERIRERRAELMGTIHLVNPYGLHMRRGDVFNLAATYFAHDPAGAPGQLARTWKSAVPSAGRG